MAAHLDAVGRWYNQAPVLVERNNHGHSVLLWLRDHSRLKRLAGHDRYEGWLSNSKGKALLYDTAADALRERQAVVHSLATFTQLSRIEGATLRAPAGEADDRADAFALACSARRIRPYEGYSGALVLWPPVPFREELAGPKTRLQQIVYELGMDLDDD